MYVYNVPDLNAGAFTFILSRNSHACAESRTRDHKLITSSELANVAELVCIERGFHAHA